MNLVIIKDSEVNSNAKVRLSDRRAEHIRSILRLEQGAELKVGVVNRYKSKAKILAIDAREVLLEVSGERVEEERPPPVELIVALPRPQTFKKVLQVSAAMGVRKLVLTRSAKVEKSYFNSSLLKAENIENELFLGLEQAASVHLPKVVFCHRFMDLINGELLPEKTKGRELLLAEPSARESLADSYAKLKWNKETRVLIAIGPEGGWVDFELEQFKKSGFTSFTMGERILRVETATAALLAQTALLREL